MSCRNFARLALRTAAIGLALLAPLLARGEQGSTPLIYEVKSGTNTVYLLGTVHVGTRKMYPLGPAVEDAFARSRVLALEADPEDQAGVMASIQRSLYQAPDSLRNHIPAQLLAQLKDALPRVGLPMEYAQTMKPALLAMTLAMMELARLGYDPAMGVDVHLARRAKEREMPLVQLESMEEQLRMFEALSEPTQQAMLAYAVQALAGGTLAGELDAMLAAWSAGDAEQLLAVIEREAAALPADAASELRESMYVGRNRAMVTRVETMLAGDVPHFVAVGAGHLLDRDGVIELLRERGYAVRRL
jgi:uncharacterized protein YbaP (TraB family)